MLSCPSGNESCQSDLRLLMSSGDCSRALTAALGSFVNYWKRTVKGSNKSVPEPTTDHTTVLLSTGLQSTQWNPSVSLTDSDLVMSTRVKRTVSRCFAALCHYFRFVARCRQPRSVSRGPLGAIQPAGLRKRPTDWSSGLLNKPPTVGTECCGTADLPVSGNTGSTGITGITSEYRKIQWCQPVWETGWRAGALLRPHASPGCR